MTMIQAFVPPEVVKMIAAFLEFCYIARRNIITNNSLEQLSVALHKFHQSHQIFSGTIQEDGPSGFCHDYDFFLFLSPIFTQYHYLSTLFIPLLWVKGRPKTLGLEGRSANTPIH